MLSIAGLVLFYFYNSGRARRPIDVNIRVADPPAAPATWNTLIVPAEPARRPPRVVAPTPPVMKEGRGRVFSPAPHPDGKATPAKTPPNP